VSCGAEEARSDRNNACGRSRQIVFSFPKRRAAVRISQRMILYTRVVELRVYEPGHTAPKINAVAHGGSWLMMSKKA
jgi:hypothetical protein